MKASVLQEKILTATISFAVVVAVATSTGLFVGIIGQLLTCYIMVLLYDTQLMQSLGTLWEVLKKEVKLAILGGFFLLCIFSDYLRFIAGGIVSLRCLILLGMVRHKEMVVRVEISNNQHSERQSSPAEQLMSPPLTTAKSHLKPRFQARTPKIFTPLINRFTSWATPVAKSSPVPFFTAKMSAARNTAQENSSAPHSEIRPESPPHLHQRWEENSNEQNEDKENQSGVFNENNIYNTHKNTSSDNLKNMDTDEDTYEKDVVFARTVGTKHSLENALTPYQPKKRSRVVYSSNFASTDDDSLMNAVLAKSARSSESSNLISQLGRPILKRKKRFDEEQVSEESLKSWLEDSKINKRRKVVAPATTPNVSSSASSFTASFNDASGGNIAMKAAFPVSTSSTTSTSTSNNSASVGFSFSTTATAATPAVSSSTEDKKVSASVPAVTVSLPNLSSATDEKPKLSVSFAAATDAATLPSFGVPTTSSSVAGEAKSSTDANKSVSFAAPATATPSTGGFSFGLTTAAPSVTSTATTETAKPSNALSFSFTAPASTPASGNIGSSENSSLPSISKSPSGGGSTPGKPPLSSGFSANPSVPFGIAFNSDKTASQITSDNFTAVTSTSALSLSAPFSFPAPATTATSGIAATSAATTKDFGVPPVATTTSTTAPILGFSFSATASTSLSATTTTTAAPAAPAAVSNPFVSSNSSNNAPSASLPGFAAVSTTSNVFGSASQAPSVQFSAPVTSSGNPFTNTNSGANQSVQSNPFGATALPATGAISNMFGTPSTTAANTNTATNPFNTVNTKPLPATNAGTNVFAATPVMTATNSNSNPFGPAATGNPFNASQNSATPSAATSNPFSGNAFSGGGFPSMPNSSQPSNVFGNAPATAATSTFGSGNPFGGNAPSNQNNANPFGANTSMNAASNPFAGHSNNSNSFVANNATKTNTNTNTGFPPSTAGNPFNAASTPALSSLPSVPSFGGNGSSNGLAALASAATSGQQPFAFSAPTNSNNNLSFPSVGGMGTFSAPAPSPNLPAASPFLPVSSVGSVNGNPFASGGNAKKLVRKVPSRK